MCRAEAVELSGLQEEGRLDSVPVVGIIKEVEKQTDEAIEADVLGVKEFQEKYFRYPTYQDPDLAFYTAMGKRKIHSLFSWNPFTWFSTLSRLGKREKGIDGNLNGEGVVLGGILVVSREKGLVYQYDEITGEPLPLEEIVSAIKNNSGH